MLKHTETIVNEYTAHYGDEEFDISWYNDGRSWYFNGDANNPKPHDEYKFDREQPYFEYTIDTSEIKHETNPYGEEDEVSQAWDTTHPLNKTHVLGPDNKPFLQISSSVSNVTIDPIPPKFISDADTEYLTLENYNVNLNFVFQDEVGLDYKQIGLFLGDGEFDPNDENTTLYYFDRKLERPIQKEWVKFYSISSSPNGSYKIRFEIFRNEEYNIIDKLNTHVNVIVWDLSGNYSIYRIQKQFIELSLSDLNELQPVQIDFVSYKPDNLFVNNNVVGIANVQVFDPNEVLFPYQNVANLTKSSLGSINPDSYERGDNRNRNPLDGISTFFVENITSSGFIEVEAWVETGNSQIDKFIKERTYAIARSRRFFCCEGRLYDIQRYVPKMLQGTTFADFIEYVELYINTIYHSLNNNNNISILEKIARIGNYNDITKIEDCLIYHYGNEFGNEINFDVSKIENLPCCGLTDHEQNEAYNIIKYVLEQLPNYNIYKGTNKGINMAIKMFGLSCKIINLWVKKEVEVEQNPKFISESSLKNSNPYFQTSYFDVSLENTESMNFDTFYDNVPTLVSLIKSIKPITKILNYLQYTIKIKHNIHLMYEVDNVNDDTNTETTNYKFRWFLEDQKNIVFYYNAYNIDDIQLSRICFGMPNEISSSSNNRCFNPFNILCQFFKYNKDKIRFVASKKLLVTQKRTFEFNYDEIQPIISNGLITFIFKNNGMTTASNMMKYVSHGFNRSLEIKLELQHGTEYAKWYS